MTLTEKLNSISSLEKKIQSYEEEINSMIEKGETPSDYVLQKLENLKARLETLKGRI